MSERALIELLYGKGTHANTLACVQDAQFERAGRRADNSPHSIWQLVNHMNFWMAYELKRIGNEKPVYPAHASESWPTNAALLRKKNGKRLSPSSAVSLPSSRRWPTRHPICLSEEVGATHPDHTKRSSSLLAVLWQTLVHNSYHIGQVVMLRRTFGAWPPKGGGDTW